MDSEEHLHLDGASRCARAFCADCIKLFAGKIPPQIALCTCPFHILQGRSIDMLASQGPAEKLLQPESSDTHSSSAPPTGQHEPGPSSDRAGAP